jgi:hypothetical protein
MAAAEIAIATRIRGFCRSKTAPSKKGAVHSAPAVGS